ASNVPDAIEAARAELGADALLLNSRPAPPEAAHLGALEVVFGVHASKRPAERQEERAAHVPQTAAPAGVDDLRQKMDEIRSLLLRSAAPSANHARIVEQVLLDAGLTPAIAGE